ncbi:putative ADP-ribosylation factor GTPase-activating protein AGD14 [Acorus calamus]|uniref:ADP-ribosylation factor GTPase-activating protein AGD14 n=1 Tax=Acorus calamus TaxID=4465 RepID=A0AAV9E233_ACOCL|nr:putative ADP-ribosylation factor GTPase-activating protein AGD14 [Acorus calamus]
MASRVKEDEKNERIIRGLLKLPANKRCMNCNSLGPQYVCTNFSTFVCTNCSGLHREFTHRVKSISMAKFTSQEVIALQDGGNERAREIYFKEWDPQRHSFPDSSNVERLRDFIKHAYVDRRFSGERNIDKPPRMKGDRDDFNENRRTDANRGSSRSPPSEDTYEHRYGERPGSAGRNDGRNSRYSYDDRRSPGYAPSDYRRSPGYFEVVDDRVKDDRFRNGNQNRKFEDRRFPDEVRKPAGGSPNHQKDSDTSSPPLVRPVRDILGDNIPPLRIGEPPKANGTRVADTSAQAQRTASSSSLGSSDGNAVELKSANFGSLIDFSAEPDLPAATVSKSEPLSSQVSPQKGTSPPTNSENWASFDFAPSGQAPQTVPNVGSLESALGQLSAPAALPVTSVSTLPVVDSFLNTTSGGQWQNGPQQHQHQPSSVTPMASQAAFQPFNQPVVGAPNNQPWGSSVATNVQSLTAASTGQLPQVAPSTGVPSQPPSAESKPTGRTALPEDLFTLSYPPAPQGVPGWQIGAHHSMAYGMQYPSTAVNYPQSSKSTNPFDLGNEQRLVHSHTFPSMASLQGALPNVAAPPPQLIHSSSFGGPSQQWMPLQQPSYPSTVPSGPYMPQQALNIMPQQQALNVMPQQAPNFMPQQALNFMPQQTPNIMPQQAPNNMLPLGHQGFGSFGSNGGMFGSLGADLQSANRQSQPATPNSFASVGGNPFG